MVKSTNASLNWPDLINARDMGGRATLTGRRTRMHALVRTDGLHKLTEAGKNAVLEYGVRTVIDLRFAHEIEQKPNAFAGDPRMRYLHLPLFELESLKDAATVKQGPEGPAWNIALMQQMPQSFEQIFRAMIDAPRGGVLFHCHVGKDRTGLIALLLGELFELPEETLVADYLESNDNLAGLFAEILARYSDKPDEQAAVRKKLYGPQDMVPVTRQFVRSNFGGVRGYLREIGLTNDEINRLHNRFVEEA